MRAGGERIDQRADGARLARRRDQAVEDPLRALELLDPDRRVRGHRDDLDDRQRVALEQVRLARAQQRVALLDVAERQVGLADHRGGEQLDGRIGRRRERPRALGGRDQRVHVAGHHVRDRRLEEHAGGAPRIARADPLGLGDQQLVGDQRRAAAHLDVAGHALHVGGQQRVGREPRRLAAAAPNAWSASPERVASVAASSSRRARGSSSGVSCAARPKSRAAVACAPRPRASSAAASSAAATSSSGATAHAARCHARSGLPSGRGGGQRGVGRAALGGAGGVVGGRAQQRVAELELAVGDRDQPRLLGGAEAVRREADLAQRGVDHVDPAGVRGGGHQQAARAPRRRARRARAGTRARRRCRVAAAPPAARGPRAGRPRAAAGSPAARAGCRPPSRPAGR